jgi:post-segregation antitoxin (ccd killing protein)
MEKQLIFKVPQELYDKAERLRGEGFNVSALLRASLEEIVNKHLQKDSSV